MLTMNTLPKKEFFDMTETDGFDQSPLCAVEKTINDLERMMIVAAKKGEVL